MFFFFYQLWIFFFLFQFQSLTHFSTVSIIKRFYHFPIIKCHFHLKLLPFSRHNSLNQTILWLKSSKDEQSFIQSFNHSFIYSLKILLVKAFEYLMEQYNSIINAQCKWLDTDRPFTLFSVIWIDSLCRCNMRCAAYVISEFCK